MELQIVPVAETAMLIRRPVSEAFEAFVNPEITSRFWFTKGSARLEAGKQVQWDWEMYNHPLQVIVKTIEENKRIVIDWGTAGKFTTVEWVFKSRSDGTTFVSVTNSDFAGNGDEVVKEALGSTEGFTIVLAAAKAFLEQHLSLNLVADRFPAGE